MPKITDKDFLKTSYMCDKCFALLIDDAVVYIFDPRKIYPKGVIPAERYAKEFYFCQNCMENSLRNGKTIVDLTEESIKAYTRIPEDK